MLGLGWLALALGAADNAAGRWLLVAVACGLLGDLLLLGGHRAALLASGLAVSLTSRLAYVLALVSLGVSGRAELLALVPVLLLAATSGRRIFRGAVREGGAGLGGAMTAYMLVIGAMVATAAGTGRPLAIVGALLFLLSDLVLALHRFVGPRAHARLVVAVTAHVGQLLIVLGVLT